MNIVTLDFETYFDRDYTLRKMTTESYIRDPRFQVLGCGVRYTNGDLQFFPDPDEFLHHMRDEPENFAVLCHHAHFDGLILSHHYGVKPRAWLDTLSMARLLLGNHLSVGLDNVARHFGLSGKTIDYKSFEGKAWGQLDGATRQALAAGCLHDVELTWRIFNLLAKEFPREEYAVVDLTVRLFTEPTLIGDIEALGKVWTDEAKRKRELLQQLGVDADSLQSAAKFTALLAQEGIEVPTKEGKNGPTPCVAKTDQFMKDLLEHDNPIVRSLAEARLGVRSTTDQTRAERLGYMANRGAMPVYLSYAGAHTTRWAGGDKVNWQNLRRGGALRKAIAPPEGYLIIKADKSQVECRFLNYLAGQMDVIEKFRNREDIYAQLATQFYGREITRADTSERGVGKQLELSCGYGAGAGTIQATAARGTYGPPVKLSDHEALAARDLYRSTHPHVVDYWKQAEWAMQRMADGLAFSWSKFHFKDGKVWLPNGAPLLYPEMRWGPIDDGEPCWSYLTRKGRKRVWGGFFVENLVQAISRVDISQTLLRIRKRAPAARLVNLEHDASVYVDKIENAEQTAKIVEEEFSRSPVWLPDLPLSCDVYIGERYA